MDSAQVSKPKPKKRAIIIGIIIVLVVTLSAVAVISLRQATENRQWRGVPFSFLAKSAIPDGFKFTLVSMPKNTPWTDVTILLTIGINTTKWSPLTTDLDNGTSAKWNQVTTVANLGTLKVNISLTDLAGNGQADVGDYFNLTVGAGQTFSSAMAYTLTLIYEPTASEIGHLTFQA